jgi:hypothetical protein
MAKNKEKAKKPASGDGFIVDAAKLVKAIDRVLQVVPVKQSGCRYVLFNGKTLSLAAQGDDSFCRIDLGAGTGTNEIFTFDDLDFLKSMVKGRGELTFTPVPAALKFKSGRFSGEIKVSQDMADRHSTRFLSTMESIDSNREARAASGIKVNDTLFGAIAESVRITRLKCAFVDNFVSVATITYDGSCLRVVSSDDWHIHHVVSSYKPTKEERRDIKPFSISVSTSVFSMLDRVINGDLAFAMDSENFYIIGDDIVVSLPPLQDTATDHVFQLLESLKKPVVEFTASDAIRDILTNLIAVTKGKDNAVIDLGITSEKIKFGHSSDRGTLSEKFKAKNFRGKELSVKLDPRIFFDTFQCIKNAPTSQFSVFNNEAGSPSIYRMVGSCDSGDITVVGFITA